MLSLEKKLCKTLVIEIAMFLFPSPGDFPNPGMKARSPALQADSLPAEPQGKPMNTGVGSLSLTRADLPDPGIQPGSPVFTWILYQLSYQGSPFVSVFAQN